MTTQKPRYQANVSLWLNCNLKCPYCWGVPSAPPGQWPAELAGELDKMRRFLTATGRWDLSFSGGEPTIYPGFSGFCESLAADGHQIEIFTNGSVPFARAFPGEAIRSVHRVSFSYHVPHEESDRLDANFEANTRYLRERDIPFKVTYILYPGRKNPLSVVKKRFQDLGGTVVFKAFQGELDGQPYPLSYTRREIDEFAEVGDIQALYFMENGNHTPTLKKCRAGQEFFYISLRTGGVYACEQLLNREVANFKTTEGTELFLDRVRKEPMVCPAKRCYCRLTMDQENFLAHHDPYDLANYSAWEDLSGSTSEAGQFWNQLENDFVEAIVKEFVGDGIYLWGGGIHTLFLLQLFQKQGFDMDRIKGIIDSNPLKHGREILGKKVVARDHFRDQVADSCSDILISSRAFEQEIYQDIRRLFGDRFHVIALYDGNLGLETKILEEGFLF